MPLLQYFTDPIAGDHIFGTPRRPLQPGVEVPNFHRVLYRNAGHGHLAGAVFSEKPPVQSSPRIGAAPLEHRELLAEGQVLKSISRTLPGKTRRRISEQNSANMKSSVRARGWESQLFPIARGLAGHRSQGLRIDVGNSPSHKQSADRSRLTA